MEKMSGKRKSVASLRKIAISTVKSVKLDEENGDAVIREKEESDKEGDPNEIAEEINKKRKRRRRNKDKTSGEEGSAAPQSLSSSSTKTSGNNDSSINNNNDNYLFNNKTVYIEGLPFSATEADVISFFEECGKPVSVRLPIWHDSGRLRGYGHVEFATDAAAKKAFDLDGCDFLDSGRYIKVDKPMQPRSFQRANKATQESAAVVTRPAGCRTVFVKNLPYDVTVEEVTEALKFCGPINNVRLAGWGHTNQLKGFGYVDFKREDSAEIAVKKSATVKLKGRPLLIDFETGAPKGSFRQPRIQKQENLGSKLK